MRWLILLATILACTVVQPLRAQDAAPTRAARGSLIEDRAARKLVEAGDARYDANEMAKAVEIWQSVIERYPTSRGRFLAHVRLGDYFLEQDRAFEKTTTIANAITRGRSTRSKPFCPTIPMQSFWT